MHRLARPISQLKAHYDVIVIGSGYGGGVSASRLARAGRNVCVLERGREFLPGEFPDRFPDLRRELQVSGGKKKMGHDTGLFDFRLGKDIHVLVGCGLGGGSLINAGVALRPKKKVFEKSCWPKELFDNVDLDFYYDRAEKWLAPRQCPDAGELTKYKALESGIDDNGPRPQAAPVAISFEDRINEAGISQAACTRCGDCFAGCNVGAKNTVAMTYLPDAAAHGAEIFTEITACHLTKCEGHWQVSYRETGQDQNSGNATEKFITAEIVILAAGTLGSTEILFRSQNNGLKLSDRLGQGFSANGDTIAFGFDGEVPVNGIGVGHPPKVDIDPVGPTVVCQVELDDPDNHERDMIIQDGSLPSAVAPLLPVLFIPGGRILGAAKALLQGVYKGALAKTQTFFVVSHDSGKGILQLDGERISVSWPDVNNDPVHARIDQALKKMTAKTGSAYVKNPLSESITGAKPATAHPLGGCGMGTDNTKGVVNHKCQVFDPSNSEDPHAVHEGLYVCDGSIIPGSLGVNPLLTITSLSERAMVHLADGYGWEFDVSPAKPSRAAE